MPYISTTKLAELVANRAEWSGRETLAEDLLALTEDTDNIQAVDNAATVAQVITALKAMKIFKDP